MAASHDLATFVTEYDLDRDGQVSKEEFLEARVARFAATDTDNDERALTGRRVTGVYYFHARPRGFSGGDLRIHDRVRERGQVVPARTFRAVRCADNRAVFFASETPHEVRPVHCRSGAFRDSRFALTVWFWTGPRVARPPGTGADRP